MIATRHIASMRRRGVTVLGALAVLCGASGTATAQTPALGPADSLGLPAVDTGRVRVGDKAPDFTLDAMAGGTVTLSQFRGKRMASAPISRSCRTPATA